jgi:hypothetical protein
MDLGIDRALPPASITELVEAGRDLERSIREDVL